MGDLRVRQTRRPRDLDHITPEPRRERFRYGDIIPVDDPLTSEMSTKPGAETPWGRPVEDIAARHYSPRHCQHQQLPCGRPSFFHAEFSILNSASQRLGNPDDRRGDDDAE